MTTIQPIPLPTPTGPAYGEALRIGLIALSTDVAIERDFHRMAPGDDVAVFTTRMKLRTPNSEETFRELEHDLPNLAELILPTSRVDVVVFGCTAASMLIGTDAIERAVQRGRAGIPVTNPAIASISALRAIGARKIAMLTPYTPSVTDSATAFIGSHGFDIVSAACLGFDLDDTHARIGEAELYESALALDWKAADAIFISCTAIRSLNIIERLEQATGKIVVTSNQAAFWHATRMGGASADVRGFGRLFEYELASLANA
ncbi:aspartate/glutamate racemase family protein [Paraburkholderia agricolaris]|uniref:maleate cis-trans isomerase family protein n=1 Tax=Paraburkholderia agricolaris TaxID=2152888 RepID=UPI0038BB7300